MALLALDPTRGDTPKAARALLLVFLPRRPLELALRTKGFDICSGVARPADAGEQFGVGLFSEGRNHAKDANGNNRRRRRSNSRTDVDHWNLGNVSGSTTRGLEVCGRTPSRWRRPRLS